MNEQSRRREKERRKKERRSVCVREREKERRSQREKGVDYLCIQCEEWVPQRTRDTIC